MSMIGRRDTQRLERKTRAMFDAIRAMERNRAATSITCPRCGQPAGYWCVTKRPRHIAQRLHPERYPS